MFFNEARSLNQLHYTNSKACNQGEFAHTHSTSMRKEKEALSRPTGNTASPSLTQQKTAEMLDSANNRMQELMQLLYLLSRDPAVPNDARYHVTVAQSEIALLAREMRNNIESQSAPATPTNVNSFSAAQP